MDFNFSRRRSYEGFATFVWYSPFEDGWNDFRLTEDDALALEAVLVADPEAGDVVSGSNGVRKFRFSPPSVRKGKSGAYRVFYLNAVKHGYILLFAIISKSEDANLSRADLNQLASEIAGIKTRLKL